MTGIGGQAYYMLSVGVLPAFRIATWWTSMCCTTLVFFDNGRPLLSLSQEPLLMRHVDFCGLSRHVPQSIIIALSTFDM